MGQPFFPLLALCGVPGMQRGACKCAKHRLRLSLVKLIRLALIRCDAKFIFAVSLLPPLSHRTWQVIALALKASSVTLMMARAGHYLMGMLVALSSSDMGRRGLSGGEVGLDKAVVGGSPVA